MSRRTSSTEVSGGVTAVCTPLSFTTQSCTRLVYMIHTFVAFMLHTAQDPNPPNYDPFPPNLGHMVTLYYMLGISYHIRRTSYMISVKSLDRGVYICTYIHIVLYRYLWAVNNMTTSGVATAVQYYSNLSYHTVPLKMNKL